MVDMEIIRSVQRRHFGHDLMSLGKGKCLKSCSSIMKLDPFIDDEENLRVGGGLKGQQWQMKINSQCCCQNPAELLSW